MLLLNGHYDTQLALKEFLRKRRKARKLSIAALAALSGVPNRHCENLVCDLYYLYGEYKPNAYLFYHSMRIARNLNSPDKINA